LKRCVIAVPHSHTWFWTQVCLSCLERFPPAAEGVECRVVVVDCSPWSPAIRGITDTRLGEKVTVIDNPKPNKYHASGLDTVVERFDCDYLFTLETDVAVLRPDWLPWFVAQLERNPDWFAVGHFHHEGFVNPSCTLYRAWLLRSMAEWCRANDSDVMRWGPDFSLSETIKEPAVAASVRGPFAEKRGWPQGTRLREPPTGQLKGYGWYEPGQALYHWCREDGDRGYLACPTFDTFKDGDPGWPIHTYYGQDMPEGRPYELRELFDAGPYACHFWRGTGALNVLKHKIDYDPKEYQFLEYCLPREARFWSQAVDPGVQKDTLALIHKHGWHVTGCMTPEVTDRDRMAVRLVEDQYRKGGVPL
jgi:hypothetical protein